LAGLLAILLVLAIRMVAIRLGIRTSPVRGFPPPDDE
jgi:hypothetical protein